VEDFDNIGQIIFVVIAVLVAALQAFSEKRKKRKAEEELFDDVNKRVEERREGGGPPHGEAQSPQTFEDLYEEYRREIAGEQSRAPTEPETFTSPWEEQSTPVPPPLPPSLPTTPPLTPVTQASPVPSWKAPKVSHASDRLTAAELDALKSFEGRKKSKRKLRGSRPSSARRLLRDPGGRRRAIVLREIIGPAKGA
jgi:type II secretory pathway pseudopilin PulG